MKTKSACIYREVSVINCHRWDEYFMFRFGEWKVKNKLDEGGFGQVFRVEHCTRKGEQLFGNLMRYTHAVFVNCQLLRCACENVDVQP